MGPQPIVLLMEDEPLIAMDAEVALRDAGFDVVSLALCAQGEQFIQKVLPAVAVLDIQLRDGQCHPLAEQLVEADVPFVVHSVLPHAEHLDSILGRGLWLQKPASLLMLVSAVIRAMKPTARILDGGT